MAYTKRDLLETCHFFKIGLTVTTNNDNNNLTFWRLSNNSVLNDIIKNIIKITIF